MNRHPLNIKSFRLFDGNYLDQLAGIYDIADNEPRPLDGKDELQLKSLIETGSDEELLHFLLTLPRFPVKDSYISSFAEGGPKHVERIIKHNPKTVERICNKVRNLGYDEVLKACTAPTDPSRQNGAKFRNWLNRTYTPFSDPGAFINEKAMVFLYSMLAMK